MDFTDLVIAMKAISTLICTRTVSATAHKEELKPQLDKYIYVYAHFTNIQIIYYNVYKYILHLLLQ